MKLVLSCVAALATFCSVSALAGTVSGPTQTQIVNSVQQAVPVRDVSWQTWRLKGNSTLQSGAVAGDFYGTGSYTVPPGKRLIIEQVSLHCGMTGATPFVLQVGVAPQANYSGEFTTVAGPAIDLGGGQYRGGAMVSVAADAGDVVFGRIVRGSYSYTGMCTQTLSGRLYDVL
jgi:hypothetical protein